MVFLQDKSLKELDPIMYELINEEYRRQLNGLEMIASENFVSKGVLDGLSCIFSMFNNDRRIELNSSAAAELLELTNKRALHAYGLDPDVWGVNVKPHSGSPANFAVLNAVLKPKDRIMGLSLQHGGHLTHGHYTNSKRVNCSSHYFESLPYVTNSDGVVDYDKLEENAMLYRPRVIIAGASGYPRKLDFERFRNICNKINAYLMVDIAHYSGLVVAGEYPSPKDYADFITTTSHKTLRGPRSAIIFYRKAIESKLRINIDESVSCEIQSSIHYNQVAALCFQLNQVVSHSWAIYANKVLENSRFLCKLLSESGINILTNGSDSHKILLDTRSLNISGAKAEKALEACEISTSRSSLPCDGRTMNCSGLRLGTAALTSRGMGLNDFKFISEIITEALNIARDIQKDGESIAEFISNVNASPYIENIRVAVRKFASSFEFVSMEEKC
ncbi:cytosolic serine hydroxymethyl transferase [Cryptosporidium canis]|uniref:Serine hydroxymethyltransferase n=1 Tax=Cryptosporidium canis TaxID=195482 RepID=A0ABQ8PB37_9CRYT|nr:cytosolic serine hydroxymethyl transferase [Cryptosporidium canis]KAJ1615122.1 cytosolic serine hydroxymethyl transferase [Cryptosporidium canis]